MDVFTTGLTFTLLILSIKREYIGTFFTTMTGKQQTISLFQNSDDDAVKADALFTNTRVHWKSIEKEARAFVFENYHKWEEERPEWWTEALKASIDDDMVPPEELRELKMKGGGKRRRSSFMEVIGLEGGGSA